MKIFILNLTILLLTFFSPSIKSYAAELESNGPDIQRKIFSYLDLRTLAIIPQLSKKPLVPKHVLKESIKDHLPAYHNHNPQYLKSFDKLCSLIGTLDEHTGLGKAKVFFKNKDFVKLIVKTFKRPKALYIKGIFAEWLGQDKKARKFYDLASRYSYMPALDRLALALFRGELRFDRRSLYNRYDDILDYAKAESKTAQDLLMPILNQGKLDQDLYNKDERFKQLLKLKLEDHKWSEDLIVEAYQLGYLGRDKCPNHERIKELLRFAEQGNERARIAIVDIFYEGYLGQRDVSHQERFEKLLALANQGNSHAQGKVANIIYAGEFGQVNIEETKRFQEILEMANKGWRRAQTLVVKALYEGKLGQNDRPLKDRLEAIFVYSEQGIREAQWNVIYDPYQHWSKFENPNDKEIFEKVKERALQAIHLLPSDTAILKIHQSINDLFAIKNTTTLRGPIVNPNGISLSTKLCSCITSD